MAAETPLAPRRDSSRRRYQEYQTQRRAREQRAANGGSDRRTGSQLPTRHIERSFWVLLREFFGLLRPQRRSVNLALATLTVSTLLKLVPPAASKVVIDYVLGDQPIPTRVLQVWPQASNRVVLLMTIGALVIAASLTATVIHLWGRWHATKAVNKLQVHVRRRVFEHIVRLPLHRVYQLKSGGTASLLREDAGGIGELIFSMLYNPWQAIIQLCGSLIILIFVDWRLLLGGLLMLPIVYLTHRTWVKRIRPVFRDVRAAASGGG